MGAAEHKYNKALVIGGSNGIGLSIVLNLAAMCRNIVIMDKVAPDCELPDNVSYYHYNLLNDCFEDNADTAGVGQADMDILVVTAGFGRIAPFETFVDKEIDNVFGVNAVALTKVIRYYYPRMLHGDSFFCAVMGSIAGLVASPMISLYSATKAAVCKLTEGINAELESAGSLNRVLNVSPGSIKGTKFNGASENNLKLTEGLAAEIIERMLARELLYIPDYDNVYKGVLERYHTDPHKFASDSCRYKIGSGRMNCNPQLRVGYLSGTFDLFHIGHLNLLRRAKECCDYLVVGVHKDASHKGKETFIPYEERCDILRNIKYVDKVIQSLPEDDEIYRQGIVKYDCLFVGSDYKGTERFNRYEAYFADKNVRIIYFPYTQGTSSTRLRNALDAISEK
ncbi:MAG: SDR family NAD(P)-dependent oxidoreductase [Bacteroidaceae bacterium]|nr:SDR family NAD(P)-dependent oxidoreductase [Bacteroidaceae bacterium]